MGSKGVETENEENTEKGMINAEAEHAETSRKEVSGKMGLSRQKRDKRRNKDIRREGVCECSRARACVRVHLYIAMFLHLLLRWNRSDFWPAVEIHNRNGQSRTILAQSGHASYYITHLRASKAHERRSNVHGRTVKRRETGRETKRVDHLKRQRESDKERETDTYIYI